MQLENWVTLTTLDQPFFNVTSTLLQLFCDTRVCLEHPIP